MAENNLNDVYVGTEASKQGQDLIDAGKNLTNPNLAQVVAGQAALTADTYLADKGFGQSQANGQTTATPEAPNINLTVTSKNENTKQTDLKQRMLEKLSGFSKFFKKTPPPAPSQQPVQAPSQPPAKAA